MTKTKIVLIRFFEIIIILAITIVFIKIANYLLVDDTSVYTRTVFHDFYSQDDINVLYLGSSHCYRGINPQIVDDELGINSFNASTSSQVINGSYYVLYEALLEHYSLDTVVLDLSYSSSRQTISSEERLVDETSLIDIYLIGDYLRNPINRLSYLTNATSELQYDKTFFPFRRINIVDGLRSARLVLNKKQESTYIMYEPIKYVEEEYVSKGFVANYHKATETEYIKGSNYPELDIGKIQKTWIDYLCRIINLCEKNNIRLVIVNIPEPMYLINSYGNYDEYIDFVNELLADKNVEYYNFNLLHEDVFPDDRTLFKDNNHLNYYGAEKFSEILAKVIDNPDCFGSMVYTSASEKLQHLGH